MKPLHLPLEGHDLLAVERFKDDTRHMAEFLILSTHCPLGRRGQYKRLFLTEDEYARMRSLEPVSYTHLYSPIGRMSRRIFSAVESSGSG